MSEHDEQVAVVEYCGLHGYPIFHIPNEAKRSPQTASRLKAEGMRSGVPDLCIPVARGGFHSLYIEMKSEKGRLSGSQAEWIRLRREQGMCAYCCKGAGDAIDLIDRYMAEDAWLCERAPIISS